MDILVHPRLPAPLRSQPKPDSIMLFRNDETKEEREAREDIFGSMLSVPADEAPTMEVDRPPTPTQTRGGPFIAPKQGPSIQESRGIPQPPSEPVQSALAQPMVPHVKMFGLGTSLDIGLPNPAEPTPDTPVASSTSTAPPIESHHAPLSSTPFIRTAAASTASASGHPPSATAMTSVWQGTAADEDENEDEDEEMPQINIESDSE